VKKALVILATVVLVTLSGIGGWLFHQNIHVNDVSLKTKTTRGTAIPRVEMYVPITAPSDRDMEREMIRYDIEESGNQIGLSRRQQEEYLVYLDSAAARYRLPMILVHTIAYVESAYDPSAIHPVISVKGKKTRAIGLMGMVWEYNGAALIKQGIASSKLELTEPRINLMAGAYIIHADIEEIFAKNPTLREDMFFDELIKKYYGAYDENYKSRILTKIKDISSKQWIRRAVKNILVNYKISDLK